MATAGSQAPHIQNRGQGQRHLEGDFVAGVSTRSTPLTPITNQTGNIYRLSSLSRYPMCPTSSLACSWPRTNPDTSWKVLGTSGAIVLNPHYIANYPLGSFLISSQPQGVVG